MNKLMEKYVYDVTRRLPVKMREDVAEELKSNIEEMLGDEYDDENVKNVLYSLGSPRSLANSYRTTKKNLISEEWMADYLYVLKIVLIIMLSIGLVFGLVDSLQNINATTFIGVFAEVVSEVISNIINLMLSGFAVVTLIFVIIDQTAENKREKWDVKDLPDVPRKNSLKISRAGSISGLIFTVIFGSVWIYLLYYSNLYFGWFNTDGNWVVESALFNNNYTRTFVVFYAICLMLDVLVYLLKIKFGQWTSSLAVLYTTAKIVGAVVGIAFLLGGSLINADFIAKVALELDLTVAVVQSGIRRIISILVGVIVFANLVDLLTMYFKQFRYISE
jgi:hypothetical protein